MLIQRTAILFAFSLQAAFAQSYAQPVREVGQEAYSAVSGFCHIVWGPSQPSYQSCKAITVPADKILAIRQISMECSGRTGDVFAKPGVRSTIVANRGSQVSYFPMQSAPIVSAAHQTARVALLPVFQHAGPGTEVMFEAAFAGQAASLFPAYCSGNFQGYFLPAVQ